MNYYPFKKFKINDKKIYPILNEKLLYPQHSDIEDPELLNQCFENVSFHLTYSIFQTSQYAVAAFCFKIDEETEVLVKFESLMEKFDKLTIDKGIIKNKMIFVSCGLKISVIFDYEEDFSFYHTELLAQGNSNNIFKTKEKDLKAGSICSILCFEGNRLLYLGKKYFKRLNVSNTTREGITKSKISVTSFVKPFHVFKYIDRYNRETYLFRKDLKNVQVHQWAGLQPIEEIKAKRKIVSDDLNDRELSPADIAYFYEIGLLENGNSYCDVNFEEIVFDENTFTYFKSDNTSTDTSYKY